MKTFKELQENLYKALAKFGTQGLRKVASKAIKKGGTKKILDAATRRAKLDQLIVKNQKKLLNIRKEPSSTLYGKTKDNLVKYKKTHNYGPKPDGTYRYKNKDPLRSHKVLCSLTREKSNIPKPAAKKTSSKSFKFKNPQKLTLNLNTYFKLT